MGVDEKCWKKAEVRGRGGGEHVPEVADEANAE